MTPAAPATTSTRKNAELIRIRGIVQGVGFRPMVWRLAREQQLTGCVYNDGQGILIRVQGTIPSIERFIKRLQQDCPPLAQIEQIARKVTTPLPDCTDFVIGNSRSSMVKTHIPPDAATCPACLRDIHDPTNRRYQYPFTNCTHCGPRLSIIRGIPYDRVQTSMAAFPLCQLCAAEYADPADRRFHAQPNACPQCGPEVWFVENRVENKILRHQAITAAANALKAGKIVAIKGIGGVHLAVDASNENAVMALRQRKQRPHKPLALMAKDWQQVSAYCQLTSADKQQLTATAAPIVLLPRHVDCSLSRQLAPGQQQLGFMLPYSPLHHLLMQQLEQPIVLTSGNLSSEPQCIDNAETLQRLTGIADAFLLHNREIVNRLDDSVSRPMAGAHRLLRRARGYAPAAFSMPTSFSAAPDILAMGSELKNTFCLGKGAEVVVSQHMGDLENFATYEDYHWNLQLYQQLYQHQPEYIVVDKHPEYLSTKLGKELAVAQQIPLLEVGHHHAHIATCLAENQQPAAAAPVLGIVLDGLGMGDDGMLWGGELLLADYRHAKRLAHLQPIPLLGGSKAMREPWRNTYANLRYYGLWNDIQQQYPNLPIVHYLQQQPLTTLDSLLDQGLQCTPAASCGRLFDAVAAAIGICTDQISFEGQAAMELEALVDEVALTSGEIEPYYFSITHEEHTSNDYCSPSPLVRLINTAPMWQALFADLAAEKSPALIATCFHLGLAECLIRLTHQLIREHNVKQVALSGGVFQNKVLFEAVLQGLQNHANVLTHRQLPANDGGLALGQWAIAAATVLADKE